MTFVVTTKVDDRLDASNIVNEKVQDAITTDVVIGTVFALSELTPPSLNLQVGTGKCIIKGYHVEITVAETLAMAINETSKVYIQLSRNGDSQVTTAVIGRTTGALPTDSMQIAEVVTDGTNIITITSKQVLKDRDDIIILVEGTTPAGPETSLYAKLSMQAGDSNNKKIITQVLRNGTVGDVYLWG